MRVTESSTWEVGVDHGISTGGGGGYCISNVAPLCVESLSVASSSAMLCSGGPSG